MDTQAIVLVAQYDIEQCLQDLYLSSQAPSPTSYTCTALIETINNLQAVEAVCWSFLQKGDAVRTRKATHPPPTRNLQFVLDVNGENKIQTDIEGIYDKPVTRNHLEVTVPTTA